MGIWNLEPGTLSPPLRIFLDSIGCRLNQSEIETLGREFRLQGHDLIAEAGAADLAVINTCAVTVDAAAASRQMLRRAARDGAAQVVATGCWATFDPAGAAALPGVSRVVPNADKNRLVPLLLGLPEAVFDLEPVAREPLPGARLRTRAFVKVQDGCDNRCTFCITTVLRGPGRSRALGDVLADVHAAVEGGAREVVLTGVHLGSWGQDGGDQTADAGLRLRDLTAAVLRETDAARIRLSSLEPWDLDRDFFSLWAGEPRLCRHLHLPLQSGCDRTLRRMARKTSQASFRKLVRDARDACPEIAITTDLIAGFPGETEDEFAETAAFVEELEFAGAHIFPYSERPGTAAAGMGGRVAHPERKRRAAALRRIVAGSERRYRERFAGRTMPVLWEYAAALGPDGWHMSGLTDNYLRVSAVAPRDLWNELTMVALEEVTEEGMRGRISDHESANQLLAAHW